MSSLIDYAEENNINIPADIVDDLTNLDNYNNAIEKLVKKYKEIEELGGDIPYDDTEAWVNDVFRCTVGDKILAEHPYMKGYDTWSQAKRMICEAAGVSTGAWRTHECKKEPIPAKWFKAFIALQVLNIQDKSSSSFGFIAAKSLLTKVDVLETQVTNLKSTVNTLEARVKKLETDLTNAENFKW